MYNDLKIDLKYVENALKELSNKFHSIEDTIMIDNSLKIVESINKEIQKESENNQMDTTKDDLLYLKQILGSIACRHSNPITDNQTSKGIAIVDRLIEREEQLNIQIDCISNMIK